MTPAVRSGMVRDRAFVELVFFCNCGDLSLSRMLCDCDTGTKGV